MSDLVGLPDPLLIEALHSLQSEFDNGLSEYALIKRLQAPPWYLFSDVDLGDPLEMFQTHFILFNALYTISDEWQRTACSRLHIHTLKIMRIVIPTHNNNHTTTQVGPVDSLKAYYLDWSNLTDTTREGVNHLLNRFWEQFIGQGVSPDSINKAKRTLAIDNNAPLTSASLKRQYRRLLQAHHPDKGGTTVKSQQINEAYKVLCATLR